MTRRTTDDAFRSRRRRAVALTLVTLLAGSFLMAILSPVKADEGGIKEIGTLVPMTSTLIPNEPDKPPLPTVPPPDRKSTRLNSSHR